MFNLIKKFIMFFKKSLYNKKFLRQNDNNNIFITIITKINEN